LCYDTKTLYVNPLQGSLKPSYEEYIIRLI
jgi:hypothetical protein